MAKELMIGVTEARTRLRELVEEVAERPVLILRRNHPVAAMVSPDRLERLYDRIEDLEDEVALLRSRFDSDGEATLKQLMHDRD